MKPDRGGGGISLVAVLALIFLLLAACGGDNDDATPTLVRPESEAALAQLVENGDPPTESELAGIWVTPSGTWGVRFGDDGYFSVGGPDINLVFTVPADAGTYALDGKLLTYTNNREAAGFASGGQCADGTIIVTEVALIHPTQLAEVVVEDSCGIPDTTFFWTKVASPGGPVEPSIVAVDAESGGGRAPIEPELVGLWIRVDERGLTRFGPDGSVQDGQGAYASDNSNSLLAAPTEAGTFHLEGDDPDTFQVEGETIVLTVREPSECPEGARRAWGAKFTDADSDDAQPRLDLTVTGDECGQAEVGDTSVWARVAP